VVVDLGDRVDAAEPHRGGELLRQDIDRLGDALLPAGRLEANRVNVGRDGITPPM